MGALDGNVTQNHFKRYKLILFPKVNTSLYHFRFNLLVDHRDTKFMNDTIVKNKIAKK